jgi:DedD protein
MLNVGAKKRLIGAAVLVVLAVVFLPLLVEEGHDHEPVPEAEFSIPAPPPIDRGRQAEVFPTLDAASPRAMSTGTAPGLTEAHPGAVEGGNGLSVDELEAVAPATPAQPVPVGKATKPDPIKTIAKPEPAKATGAKQETARTAATKPDPKAEPAKPDLAKAKSGGTAPKPVPKGLGSWVVQVAALATPEAAQKLESDLRAKGFSAFTEKLEGTNRTLWRVRVGPEVDRSRVDSLAEDIKRRTGLGVMIQKYRDG